MLQEELPAEISFYVPEMYHRRIIGVGGKNIQRIMKKYGVYVKFAGAEEFTTLGGYYESEDNVIARTPMKNEANLKSLKFAITSLILFSKDRDFVFSYVSIPHNQHRVISSMYGDQLREVCNDNHARIWWPERTGSDKVAVYGPQDHVSDVTSFIQQFISLENTNYGNKTNYLYL
jgi:hypothetical protein